MDMKLLNEKLKHFSSKRVVSGLALHSGVGYSYLPIPLESTGLHG